MKRVAFLSSGHLLDKARQLATDVEPWATTVRCFVGDYVEAGLRGVATKLPIPKQAIGSAELFANRAHPLSPDYLEQMAREMKESTHVVLLVPSHDVQPGTVEIEVPA